MPTYVYKCYKCGNFDYYQPMSHNSLETCPTCGGKVNKIFTSTPVMFSGSGFYTTDSKNK
jgi:putative FmdB family regulatory protein